MEWIETIYNCIALVLATYSIYGLAQRFFNLAPSYVDFLSFPWNEKCSVFNNKYLLGICFVLLAYVGLSFWLDNQFFGAEYKEITLQLKGRSKMLSWYAFFAAFYGYHKSQRKKSKQQLDIANFRVKIYQDTTSYIKSILDKININ